MRVHYSSDGELSATMALDTLIENLGGFNRKCWHGDAIDLEGLRHAIENGREFTGWHDFGRFVVRPI